MEKMIEVKSENVAKRFVDGAIDFTGGTLGI